MLYAANRAAKCPMVAIPGDAMPRTLHKKLTLHQNPILMAFCEALCTIVMGCGVLLLISVYYLLPILFSKLRAKIQLKIQLCTCVREKFSQDKKTRLKFVFSVNNDYLCTHKNGKVLYGMLPSNPPGPDSSKGSWL